MITDSHGSYVIIETMEQLTTKFGLDMVTLFCTSHTTSSPWMCPITSHSKQHLEGLNIQPWQETIVLAKQVHMNGVGKEITRKIFNQTQY